jgi:hypothetical protein
VSDIDTAVVDSLKALDPNRPIREADNGRSRVYFVKSSGKPATGPVATEFTGGSVGDCPELDCIRASLAGDVIENAARRSICEVSVSRRLPGSLPPAVMRAVEKKRKIAPKYNWAALAAKTPYFDPLSDDEWQNVWRQITCASAGKKAHRTENVRSLDSKRIRMLVDRAAARSGWFGDSFSELHFPRPVLEETLKEHAALLGRISDLRREATIYFRERDDLFTLSLLRKGLFAASRAVSRNMKSTRSYLQCAQSVPSASKPERDSWMGLLMLVWKQECHLPTDNSKHLRNFIMEALRPYMPHIKERMRASFQRHCAHLRILAIDGVGRDVFLPAGDGERLVENIRGLRDGIGRGEDRGRRAGEDFLGARNARQPAAIERCAIVRFFRFGFRTAAGKQRQAGECEDEAV